MSKVRFHIVGKVQGVLYRQSAQEKAKSFNLVGWVKNLPNGSVLLEAEGPVESIQSLLLWCKSGPPRAKVEAVEVTWLSQEDKPAQEQAAQEQAAQEQIDKYCDFHIIG